MGKKKGGKSKRRGKTTRDSFKKDLTFKVFGQEYAQIVKMLGNGRVQLMCFDGKTRLGIIRGALRKRVWMSVGDIILIGLRDFQDSKADILAKYSMDEARQLKGLGELPVTAKIGDVGTGIGNDEEEECAFDFDAI